MDTPSDERVLASAIHYLIQGQEFEAANMLLLCRAEIEPDSYEYDVTLYAPREILDASKVQEIDKHGNLYTVYAAPAAVYTAFRQFRILNGAELRFIRLSAALIDIDTSEGSNWREELRAIIKSGGITNQAREIPERKVVLWNGLRFRSEAERLVAIALDKKGVLFFPNCAARLTLKDASETRTSEAQRDTREPDFLVCHKGKWGILEVDGPFHDGRAAHDNDRDVAFQKQGIRVIRHYPAERCMSDSVNIIREFLGLLETIG